LLAYYDPGGPLVYARLAGTIRSLNVCGAVSKALATAAMPLEVPPPRREPVRCAARLERPLSIGPMRGRFSTR
jgi:hypothetical protein